MTRRWIFSWNNLDIYNILYCFFYIFYHTMRTECSQGASAASAPGLSKIVTDMMTPSPPTQGCDRLPREAHGRAGGQESAIGMAATPPG